MNTIFNKLKSIEVMRFALLKESDRGACLLAISYLEKQLENLLKQYLVKSDTKLTKDTFEGYGPLSSFSAKIDMSFLLGLISKATRSDLHKIRKIRNEFAHSPESIHFDSTKIKEICLHLNTHFRENNEEPRDIFISTVCGIIGRSISSNQEVLELKDPDGIEILKQEFKKNMAKK